MTLEIFLARTLAMLIDRPERAKAIGDRVREVLGLSPDAAVTPERIIDAACTIHSTTSSRQPK